MYIIEMVDDWDRTIQTWIVNRSEEEVSDFVRTMNLGLADKLRKEVKSSTECYFYYRKCEVIDLPTEEEIKELLKCYTYFIIPKHFANNVVASRTKSTTIVTIGSNMFSPVLSFPKCFSSICSNS